jgi:hypothetical protein
MLTQLAHDSWAATTSKTPLLKSSKRALARFSSIWTSSLLPRAPTCWISGTQFTCLTHSDTQFADSDAQFTCFTGPKVQILTQLATYTNVLDLSGMDLRGVPAEVNQVLIIKKAGTKLQKLTGLLVQ